MHHKYKEQVIKTVLLIHFYWTKNQHFPINKNMSKIKILTSSLRYRREIPFLGLSEFNRINELLFPLKSSRGLISGGPKVDKFVKY